MTASLLIFPVDHEKAVRLGARARLQDWPLWETRFPDLAAPRQTPFPDGRVIFQSNAGSLSESETFCTAAIWSDDLKLPQDCMADARAENERLKRFVGVGPLGRPNAFPEERTPCARLDAALISESSLIAQRRPQGAAGAQPSFYFGGVHFGDVSLRPAVVKAVKRWGLWFFSHFILPMLSRGRAASRLTLRAQPGPHHGNRAARFPRVRPDAFKRDDGEGQR
jgi:hypothetical protein